MSTTDAGSSALICGCLRSFRAPQTSPRLAPNANRAYPGRRTLNRWIVAETDLIIVGAGVAGLAAASVAREAGKRAIVLEASRRVGGRAWTDYPAVLGGVWFDVGAVWFHDAERNPLVDIALAAGDRLLRSDEMRQERTFVGDRLATAAELAAYDAAPARFEAAADAALAEAGDVSLAGVTARLPDDPWAPTIEAWEGPVICAADSDRFSARDWRRNALSGSNMVPEGGIGAFVARRLTPSLDIRLNTPVTRVWWGGRGITVETPAGSLTARGCVVTASTGVLAADVIAFDPILPARVVEAVHALPMGLAIKIVLRANEADRLDLPTHCSVDYQVARSREPLMPVQCWPLGRDYVQGWIGGSTAWDLARQPEAAATDYLLAHLRRLFGGRVDRLFAGRGSLVTHWDADPWVRGAYSYAVPGASGARDTLAEPVGDGRLMFAGEACNVPFAGTVAGSWISGQHAARVALGI